MMTSSVQMFPDAKDSDSYAPAKRTAAAANQFSTSRQLYGDDLPKASAKKSTGVKTREIGGSDCANPLTTTQ